MFTLANSAPNALSSTVSSGARANARCSASAPTRRSGLHARVVAQETYVLGVALCTATRGRRGRLRLRARGWTEQKSPERLLRAPRAPWEVDQTKGGRTSTLRRSSMIRSSVQSSVKVVNISSSCGKWAQAESRPRQCTSGLARRLDVFSNALISAARPGGAPLYPPSRRLIHAEAPT